MRQKEKHGTISAVCTGASVFITTERAGRVGERPSLLFHSPNGGAPGPEPFRAGVQRRGRGAVSPGADTEGLAVCLRGGDDVGAAAGTAHPGRFGLALSGGRSAAGQLGVERIPAAARPWAERRVHAGAGDGAADEAGAVGTGGDRFDAHLGWGFAQPAGDGTTLAARAGE